MAPPAAIFLGIDIGKTAHFGVAIDVSGTLVRQWRIGNDEPSLRRAVKWAQQRNGTVIVDQVGVVTNKVQDSQIDSKWQSISTGRAQ